MNSLTNEQIAHAAKTLKGNTFKLWLLLRVGYSLGDIYRGNFMNERTAFSALKTMIEAGFGPYGEEN